MKASETIVIRPFREADVPQLLDLMKGLAVFEDYADHFAVTESDLVKYGLKSNPSFEALVALRSGETELFGVAITYIQPFNLDMRPATILLNLFVKEKARGLGIGRQLFDAVSAEAKSKGSKLLKWTVMSGNNDAEIFYTNQGGKADKKWKNWLKVLR